MDNETKAKWLLGLRGGTYSQTVGVFSDSNGHCCLGVLLDVTGNKCGGYGKAYPTVMEEKFGIAQGISMKLARMNDDGATFAQIAEYIETTL